MKMPPWTVRRRAIFGAMFFSIFVITYVMIRWDDTNLAETLVLASFALIGTVVTAYIGGAAYQDAKLWNPKEEETDVQ